MRLVHIIPTYNEKENIKPMIEAIEAIGLKHPKWHNRILVVDDYSPDGTDKTVREIMKKKKNVFLISKNKEGLGRALIAGYKYAVEKLNAEVVIPNDADFQWDPRDYPKLVKKIEEGFDVAVASRHVPGGKIIGWNWFRKLNHEVSNTLLAWWFAGVKEVKDHAGNFKAIRVKGCLDRIVLEDMKNAGFSFQLHILYELSKVGAKFAEVPVIFRDRKSGVSKIGFNRYYIRDIFEYIKSSLLIRIDRSKTFFRYVTVGVTGFTIQTLLSKLFITFRLAPNWAVAIGAEGAIISNFLFNNYWTFGQKRIRRNRLLAKFLQFNGVSLGAVFLQWLSVGIGTSIFGHEYWFIIMVFSIITLVIPYSFFAYSKIIWRQDNKKK